MRSNAFLLENGSAEARSHRNAITCLGGTCPSVISVKRIVGV